MTNEDTLSPGCTRADINILFFSLLSILGLVIVSRDTLFSAMVLQSILCVIILTLSDNVSLMKEFRREYV